jgi:hypothetical protein
MLDWIFANYAEILQTIMQVIGAAAVLVATLEKLITPMREWAQLTRSLSDDKAVERFALVVGWVSGALLVLSRLFHPLAMRKAPPRRVISMRPPPLSPLPLPPDMTDASMANWLEPDSVRPMPMPSSPKKDREK